MSGGFVGYQRARISSRNPASLGRCDRCAFVYNLRELRFQYYWRGPTLQNTQFLVCPSCLDVPNQQDRTIVIPPDPLPLINPRVEDYAIETTNWLTTQDGQALLQEDGQAILTQGTISGMTAEDFLVTEDDVSYFTTETGEAYFITDGS